MKIKVSEATNIQLNWMVAKAQGLHVRFWTSPPRIEFLHPNTEWTLVSPSTNWAQGGPLLSKERISRTIDHSGLWIAYWTDGYTEGDEGKLWMQCDRSELVAGLRCYVMSELGKEVEVPDELCGPA